MAAETLILEAPPPPRSRLWRLLPVSIALHVAILLALGRDRPRPPPPQVPIDFDVVHVEPPPPPPPPLPDAPPAPKPQPHPVIVKRPELKPPEPPPSNQPPPPAPTPAPPIRVGISLESTTNAPGPAYGTGNTAYGKADTVAGDPGDAQGYVDPETKKGAFVPASQLTTVPHVIYEPPHEYPEEARKSAIEGQVITRIKLDASGKVTSVKILEGPGHGLEEAAKRALLKTLFAPAMYQGRPVATEIPYVYSFLLE